MATRDRSANPVSKVAGAIKARVDAVARRHKAVARALEVQARYNGVHGNNLAAVVTFQAFVSLLPMLLLIVAVVGFFSASGRDIASKIIGQLGLTGEAAKVVADAVKAARQGRKTATVIGVVGLLWSGLGLVNAVQYAYDQIWHVRERGLKDKAFGALWLVGAGILFVASAAVTAVVRWLPGPVAPIAFVVGLATSFALWMWTGRILLNVRLPWRALVPGAIFGAIGLEVLQGVGAFYVPRLVASSSQLYGSLGVVFATLAWLYFFGRLIVYTAVIGVVAWERKHGTVTETIDVPRQPNAEDPGQDALPLGRLRAAG